MASTSTGDAESSGVTGQEPKHQEHHIRITSHGKIQNWVSFALNFFDTNADKPLVLHTLPATPSGSESAELVVSEAKKLSSATACIPRLISVVEIIKREYLKKLHSTSASHLPGLHQYNKIGILEDSDASRAPDPDTEDDTTALEMALMGKNYPRQEQTPFMSITLCRKPLTHLEGEHVTYQPPEKRKVSKSARARAKRREKKEEALHN